MPVYKKFPFPELWRANISFRAQGEKDMYIQIHNFSSWPDDLFRFTNPSQEGRQQQQSILIDRQTMIKPMPLETSQDNKEGRK